MLQNQVVDVVGLGVVNRKGSRPYGKKITVRAQAGPNDQVQDLIVLGNIDDVLRKRKGEKVRQENNRQSPSWTERPSSGPDCAWQHRRCPEGKKITVRAQAAPDNQVEDLSVRGNIDDVLKEAFGFAFDAVKRTYEAGRVKRRRMGKSNEDGLSVAKQESV
ncbi:hypothetical protein niasHT_025622 [Heterodera trifolii]|uniref:Uncharacterized protein n=1 Tax=Heterodera trifolii TaxID=157864 RepID=A0ABD2KHN6_9BILA